MAWYWLVLTHLLVFGLGYGYRGLIGRELRALHAKFDREVGLVHDKLNALLKKVQL